MLTGEFILVNINNESSFIKFFTDPILPSSKNLDTNKENIWILEIDSKLKRTISIMKIDEETAQLRWLLIEAEARSLGYGKQLIEQAVQFCKDNGYKRIFLWTNNVLSTARILYERVGFRIIKVKDRKFTDHEIKEEKWELIIENKN
jgi:N-acetylglutamate synthase-like GNAT family acetyltransferase